MDAYTDLHLFGSSVGNSDFWFRFLGHPYRKQNSDSVFDSEDSGQIFVLNSDVWRVRKLEFRFQNLEFRYHIRKWILIPP
jgi:hypothetical protein